MTDIIMDSAVKDSPELVIDLTRKAPEQSSGDTSKEVNGTSSQGDSSMNPPPTARTPATPSKPGSTTPLRIEERTYFTVKATHEVLELLLDYLKVVVNMNMLTTDTMSRVIEFLKAFNSRTCQVVLGAGAMRSAGLKNITAKHLGEYNFFAFFWFRLLCIPALASQSLSVVFELIPYVRETFRRHLSQKQAVMLVEFDKLKRVCLLVTNFFPVIDE
jgi:vacuolar protein sorting-associated protein 54